MLPNGVEVQTAIPGYQASGDSESGVVEPAFNPHASQVRKSVLLNNLAGAARDRRPLAAAMNRHEMPHDVDRPPILIIRPLRAVQRQSNATSLARNVKLGRIDAACGGRAQDRAVDYRKRDVAYDEAVAPKGGVLVVFCNEVRK